MFHVHGHKNECFTRYASTFILGTGVVDGEIIETLWEPLNHIAPSTRKVSLEHHWEIIDDHMNDSNWKKLLHMGVYVHVLYIFCNLIFSVVDRLCAKYPTAIIE